MRTTAILIDGGFFLRRFSKVYPDKDANDPAIVARTAHTMATQHLKQGNGVAVAQLYRIFFYDCPPLTKKVHNPISKRSIDLSKSPEAVFRQNLHDHVRQLRKTALRLGRRDEENAGWQIKKQRLKPLLSGKLGLADLSEHDVTFYARQKVVDMKIGLDIASLSLKSQVNQIVLVSGDSDFVPAAKLARREGVDFILDPMWHNINPDLGEHIDGLKSTAPRPNTKVDSQSSLTLQAVDDL
ncbi:NYN domain-containing protein [Ferruginivarius sediminum]|uniref:NYN domain-containing protein n=1 Tax=Ferruginivarius sediminum TaxID=2661937 RepID=A0A369T999_9PROT|nr:NYN domain-containing protein [Ferruginivarius sediminum]RDD61870.1 NYN domain-containing protein [Ferruginivarius sediminum]